MNKKMGFSPAALLVSCGYVAFALTLGFLLAEIPVSEQSAGKLAFADGHPLSGYRQVEVRANTFTSNRQNRSAVDVDGEGNVLAVWASRRQEAGTYGVFAQRFDPLGRPLGTELHVNQFLPGPQNEPAVAFDADNVAWVAWQSPGQDGSRSGIFVRRFGEVDGEFGPLGDEILVNVVTDGEQITPGIASNENGRVLVAWSASDNGGGTGVRARVFNADGSPATGELELSGPDTGGRNRLPAVTGLPGDRFLVAWAHTTDEGKPESIMAGFVDSGNPAPGAAVLSDPGDGRENIEPSVTVDGNGNILLAWMRSSDTGGYDVVSRKFNPDGSPAGGIFLVSDRRDGWKSGVSIAAAADGRFVVSYNLYGEKDAAVRHKRPQAPSSIYAQMYDAEGNRLGNEFRVNRYDEGKQALPVASNATHTVWSGLDQLVFAWNGCIDGDKSASGLTLMAPASLQVPEPPAMERVAAASDITSEDVRTPPDFNPDWVPEKAVFDGKGAGPDFGFMAFQTTAWTPPDPDIAVGPDYLVSVVNMDIRVHTKSGTLISSELLEDFFSGQSGGTFLFDPVAAYDNHAGRYVVATADHQGYSQDGLNVAVSKTSDPTDGWHKYYFQTDNIGDYIDFENLGIGTDAYYVTADYFGWPGGNVIHIFEKDPMLSGDPVTLKYIKTSSSLLSLGAVKTYDADPPAQYFATSWTSSTKLRLYAVRNATGTPTISNTNITVPYFTYPPDATQYGSSNRVDTVDDRIKHGVYRNGSLWLTHTIGENNTARVRWYEIKMNNWPVSGSPTLVQSGTLDYGTGEHNWFPDITVTEDDDAVITCNRSSSGDYPYIARAGRKFYDAAGAFRASVRLKESDGPTSQSRWGDYSGNDEDIADPGVVWSHTEYTLGDATWRTWAARTDTDKLMVFDEPGTLVRGTNVTFTAHGAAPFGTVYFAYSLTGAGSTYIAGLDATLDLANPQNAGSAVADGDGDVSLTRFIPGGAPVGPIYIQTIERNNTSNLITTAIN